MLNQKIGAFIALLRKEQNLTQEQLAELLGVSNRSVSRWENGNTLPDLSLLHALSGVLGVSLAELLNGQRLDGDAQKEASVRLALELAQHQQDQLRKTLNWRFGAGLALTVCAILLHRFANAPGVFYWLCAGLGIVSFLGGFWCNNRKPEGIQSSVLTTEDANLHMKSAAEMLHFSMKYQSGQVKQHRSAFAALENSLQPDEYAVFTFIGSSYTVSGHPGPWHVSAALTNKRLLLAGEQVRGQLLTSLHTDAYDREDIRCLQMKGRTLVFDIGNLSLAVEGDQLPIVCEKVRCHL